MAADSSLEISLNIKKVSLWDGRNAWWVRQPWQDFPSPSQQAFLYHFGVESLLSLVGARLRGGMLSDEFS